MILSGGVMVGAVLVGETDLEVQLMQLLRVDISSTMHN